MRTCDQDKSSKNDRKTQINIETRDFFPIPKRVCVCGRGTSAKSVGRDMPPPPVPHEMMIIKKSKIFQGVYKSVSQKTAYKFKIRTLRVN